MTGTSGMDDSGRAVTPPARLLLCLCASCHGEFYYPMAVGESPACPNNTRHAVAIYEHSVNVTARCEGCDRPIRYSDSLCEGCGVE